MRLKRLISAPVFRLKGSGWYETDFKSDKENKRNLAGAEPAATEAKPAETKPAETKPETKLEEKRDLKAISFSASAMGSRCASCAGKGCAPTV